MCGIIGYIGEKETYPILIEGLKRLEYRGYDSAGVVTVSNGKLQLFKQKGKIKDLEASLKNKNIKGHIGLGHTRWATHGVPNKVNAHPHTDCEEKIIVVHNGIIENYEALKYSLKREGHIFKSQTDTEVIPHLIEKYYDGNLELAVRLAVRQLKGAYALGIISKREPDKIIACRLNSPLVIGIGHNENFLASDIPAILGHTKKVMYLNDLEMAVLTKNSVRIMNMEGKEIKRNITTILWDASEVGKGKYPHFMLKEIHEQPKVAHRLISQLVDTKKATINFEHLKGFNEFLSKMKEIAIVACGTAYHAGFVGKYILEEFTRIPVSVEMSSEFRYKSPRVGKETLVIAVSQSGETADTLASIREAKRRGARVLTICNVMGSTMTRESEWVIYTHAGPEIGVASTKAYTTQLIVLYLLMIYLARRKGKMTKATALYLLEELSRVPKAFEEILKHEAHVQKIAKKYSKSTCFLFLARHMNYPSALEGALKLKEVSYIHGEGYPAGEMKHGHIALIDKYLPVVCIATNSIIYDKMVSNIQEIKSREGIIIVIASEDNKEIKEHADEVIYVPKIDEIFSPLLVAIPLQLLAYHVAAYKGCDIDQPRNLAKSVTVE